MNCSYSGRVHQHRYEVEVLCERDFALAEFCLPDVFQQHVAKILVKRSTVRQEASELENIPHKSAKERSTGL